MPDPAKPIPFGLALFKDRLQNILLPSCFLHKSIRRIFIKGEFLSLSESAVHICPFQQIAGEGPFPQGL